MWQRRLRFSIRRTVEFRLARAIGPAIGPFARPGLGLSLCLGLALATTAHADEVTVAVAANFLLPLESLAAEFESTTGHDVAISPGSTGQLYAQIVNGAPFDVLLAADAERPRLLAESGLGDADTRFTYALGRLALWSRDPALVDDALLERLGDLDFRFLAIAEPAIAPYGAAARETLESLGLWELFTADSRIVRGQSIAQTFAMIETRNAELGFIALSQAVAYDGDASWAVVAPERHAPIRQDAILLVRASGSPAARQFLDFLRSPAAAAIIESFGYGIPASANPASANPATENQR